MTKLYLLFFVTLIIFIISTEFISFRYTTRGDINTLKIDFNIFGITLIKDKRKKRQKKEKRRKAPPPSFKTWIYFFKSVISKSHIEIHSLNFDFSYDTPSEYAYKRTAYTAFIGVIISYLHNYSKSVQYINTDSVIEEDTKCGLDIKISLNLIFLISSIATLITKYIKELIRKNGRKQNERYN